MNRKGEEGFGSLLQDNFTYLLVLIAAVAVLFVFIADKQNGAAIWEDYYVQEIVFLLNNAKPGDSFSLDVHKATEIASSNKIGSFSEIFIFNNVENEVCVKLDLGKQSCLNYFTDLDITEVSLELATPVNTLKFKTMEREDE